MTNVQRKAVDASQPAFKPRNVKKVQDSKYRDRAAERRVGDGNDYAHVRPMLMFVFLTFIKMLGRSPARGL
jgi:hypothetical protein